MTLEAELDKLKDSQRDLLKRVVRYGEELLSLEKRLLTEPDDGSVKDRMIQVMADGNAYSVRTVASALGVPSNTVQVTLRRFPKTFQRVGWGLYRVKNYA
jgi:DNA-directed RNA polymerase specialized sigma24 family protein